jgi:hypothetical protein
MTKAAINPTVSKTPSARELVAARKKAAAQAAQAPQEQPKLPAVKPSTFVAAPDNRIYRERYLDEVSPTTVAGRIIKFSKDGFVTPDDKKPVSDDVEFLALCDQTVVGLIKFNGEGQPPDRVMGLLYDGFQVPPRESLGDLDPTKWDEGLDGQPADPWMHQMCVVLQRRDTAELFTFITSSVTGRRAVGQLLKHYDRLNRSHPGSIPIVYLREGGYQHREQRIGWVSTPVFAVVGATTEAETVKPNTPTGDILNDSLSF